VHINHSRSLSSSVSDPTASSAEIEKGELRKHFVTCAVPMVAFGFIDNTVMLHAGNFIDLTLGVTFGLSTLAAAACGQVCSDSGGVLFGSYIFAAAQRMGLPEPKFTPQQKMLRMVRWTGNAGAAIGVFCGCCLGLVNLFLIDTNEARQNKLFNRSKIELDFAIDISNVEDPNGEFTCVTVEGPDVEGVIASITTAMAVFGCKIQAMHGFRGELQGMSGSITSRTGHGMCFTFTVHKGGMQVPNEKLEDLAKVIHKAAKEPNNVNSLNAQNEQLRVGNAELQARLEELHDRIQSRSQNVLLRRTSAINRLTDIDLDSPE